MAEKPQKSKKPTWVIDKERARRAAAAETVWLFGLHAVRDALANPRREKLRLVVTQNALDRLGPLPEGMEPEITDARVFDRAVPLPPESVHQGAALEVKPLKWGSLTDLALSGPGRPLLVALDRVTDPHNVGAILRSAEVFGARAVIAPARHSAPETGALAKTASGALERQPYLRVTNLADTLIELQSMGYTVLGRTAPAPRTCPRRWPNCRAAPSAGAGRRGAGPARPHPRDLRPHPAHPLCRRFRLAQCLERGGGGALRRLTGLNDRSQARQIAGAAVAKRRPAFQIGRIPLTAGR
jgi:23S rRNA (guanosine2251-2'-O)-methyltransferase